jgi:hypothetical protein
MLHDHGESDAIGKMKQFATYFTHGVRNGAKLRTEIYRAQEVQQILNIVDVFFTEQLSSTPVSTEPAAEYAGVA